MKTDFPSSVELKKLSVEELRVLCGKMRTAIIGAVAANGGHLASSLGAVELIAALHYVFDIPDEPLIFDVGHQALAHKLLTGRAEKFDDLRRLDGISGFPSPLESACDTGISGHAGVAVSQAIGLAQGRIAQGKRGKVIAFLGDGALNCGITYEGLNSAQGVANLVIVLNDNNMAIAPNVGAVARYLNRILSNRRYNDFKDKLRLFLQTHDRLYHAANRIDDILKSALLPPSTIFQELGIRYIGPIDGHPLDELIPLFTRVREMAGPVLIHAVTVKGKGCSFAEKDPELYHGISGCDPVTGAFKTPGAAGFSQIFGETLARLGETHPELHAITASMVDGTGLAPFQRKFPHRCHDVGIAEEHAVAYAAGLAQAHLRPVVALYSTFAQRALDNIYHDIALAKLPVIFAFDRAGVVADGPTHHGIYDLGFLRQLPNLEILAPATEKELEKMLEYLLTVRRPAVIRYPRGTSGCDREPAPVECGKAEILRRGADVTLWALGTMTQTALDCAEILHGANIEATVVNARFIAPFDAELARELAGIPAVALEDQQISGGLGAARDETLGWILWEEHKGEWRQYLSCFEEPHFDVDFVERSF
ncbi:MAG: 1-deoxy-D-xylulose-5-phosphate synthase [Victivallaceae bacterium]|nr:1-deoxy-D-xylulose-5-phosphate synthase [Victivallaceae bacterium]